MRQDGFTLMEVLIAVAITAVIGLGVWQVLDGVVTSRDRVDERAAAFDELQRTMLLLERDLTQVVNRPARDLYGDFQPALTSREEGFALMLTRQGWRNPLGLRRSSLQRVAWEYTGSELRRRYWPTVDQGQEDNGQDILLLNDVQAFQVEFLDQDSTWQEQWPPDSELADTLPGEHPETSLPRAIRITLEHGLFGEIERLFPLPDFDPEEAQALIDAGQAAGTGTSGDDESSEEPEETGTGEQGGTSG
jgi:general secretion pathway protein J